MCNGLMLKRCLNLTCVTKYWFVGFVILLGGCAVTPPSVVLTPELSENHPYPLAANEPVLVRVVDRRPYFRQDVRLLGFVNKTDVVVENDLVNELYQVLDRYLVLEGFRVVPVGLDAARGVNLSVVEFYIIQRFAIIGSISEVRLRLDVSVQNGPERYAHRYTVNDKQFTFYTSASRSDKITQQLNTAFSQALRELLSDPVLLNTLIKDVPVTVSLSNSSPIKKR